MSLKAEIEVWVEAINQYDNSEFEEALKSFDKIADTSRILFNCGVIHATLGEHDKAVECYQKATSMDQYLAVSYFQQGVSNFLVGDFEEALANFNDTLLYLRGNTFIDYDQLGLKFKLYSCEALFNRGLCYIYLQQKESGMNDLNFAVKEKLTPDHDVIDDAIRDEAEGYTVFSIPVGIVYRPNPAKVKNLKTKDYLGRARLVAASDQKNAFTGFAGTATKIDPVQVDSKDDRPQDAISFAASNLVRNDLSSRSVRQQSAPPINRNMFPPTPPPENEGRGMNKSAAGGAAEPTPPGTSRTERANSVRNGPMGGSVRMPQRRPTLDPLPDGQVSPPSAYPPQFDRPRQGTIRTASEPRGPNRYGSRSYRDGPPGGRSRMFMERGMDDGMGDMDEYPDELYDMYRNTANTNPYATSGSMRRSDPRDGYGRMRYGRDSVVSADSIDEDFEMMPAPRRAQTSDMGRSRGASRSGYGSGYGSAGAEPDVSQLRVKMHLMDDTRYMMCRVNVDFETFCEKVREKMGLRGRFRVKIKDEGDLITVGDRDDWDLQVSMARKEARRKGDDMGRLEVWVSEVK